MLVPEKMEGPQNEHPNTPESSPNSSDTEGIFIESETMLRTVNEPDVSLDEMLSLACRQGKLDIVQLLLQSGAQVNHRNKAGNTPLLEACSQGHVLVANYLLENGSKIDTPTETTLDSALTWACTLGNAVIVEALLHKNADVEHRTKDGCTALMFACLAGHRDVAEKLLDAQSEVNVESDSNKDSPLTFACWKGHHNVVALLLQRDANIEHRTKEGFSPLMFAALGGHTNVARKLLECNAQVNVSSGSNNDIPLTSACWKGHSDVVKLLLEFTSNIEHRTKDGCTPLMLAAREGHISVAELLLKNKAQVNVPSGSENNIPLTLACWKGHSEVVKLLLEYGSDIEHRNKAGCTPLMLAAREGHFKTTALLLSHCAHVNIPSGSNDDTPLTLACWKGHKNVLLLLLQSKSNIDHQTKTGCTPLMEATREGHKDVAEILLNHNAGVELPDNYGQSPLFMACWKGHRDVAELLLQRNAYRDCRTKTGITPLFQACRENHVTIVKLLIEYGAGVNTPFPNSRENPMTLCAEKGHQILIVLLLAKGATHDCRTKKGCTPLFLACKEGHIEIAKILSNHGANLETPDCRGNTPIMASYKNGHVVVVEWLIKSVNHLPSDELCHKILMSTVDEKEKELIVQNRSKCLNFIQEAKRKRELLALENAQNLVQELDEEKTREEKKKTRKKEKRRDKRNKRKKVVSNENIKPEESMNGINVIEDEEEEEEEMKDLIVPTENRQNNDDDLSPVYIQSEDVLKISMIPAMPLNIDLATTKDVVTTKKACKKFIAAQKQKNLQKTVSQPINEAAVKQKILDISNGRSNTIISSIKHNGFSTSFPIKSKSPTNDVVELLANQLNNTQITTSDIARQLPKTSGICTQSSSTSGSSRLTSLSQQKSSVLSTVYSSADMLSLYQNKETMHIPVVSSIAATTSLSVTTSQSDPRTDVSNITPIENSLSNGWDEANVVNINNTTEKVVPYSADSNSQNLSNSVSRTNSFDEYKEMDWREVTRTNKNLVYELVVPNGYCGRVIGKGGKKINLITDESGAQITIDKPPANVVPADRVITIKGAPSCVEKACALVTKALNTPSLNNRLYDSSIAEIESKTIVPPISTTAPTVSSMSIIKSKNIGQPEAKKSVSVGTKSIASADVSVTPLVTYTQVAKGVVSLENIQKQILSKKPQASSSFKINSLKNPSVENTPNKESTDIEIIPPIASSPKKEFSYFSEGKLTEGFKNESALKSHDDIDEPSTRISVSTKDNESKNIMHDRNRSVSWTGNPKRSTNSSDSNTANRSHSTETITYNSQVATTPNYNITASASNCDDLADEQVFPDESLWPVRLKDDVISNSATAERWEVSSSPTSSVSSSKIELTSILNDNDSGMGGSNPLGPTPDQNEPNRIGYQDAPYLETTLENTPWLQTRGAYSAPSSPALQRNNESGLNKSSQQNLNIRSQLSMENLNCNKGWMKSNSAYYPWSERKSHSSPARFDNINDSSENSRDSAVSSPHLPLKPAAPNEMESPNVIRSNINTSAKTWSAERFQDVKTVSDLLDHLALEKYSAKLQEKCVTLESMIIMSEKDLQMFDIPKGPRLKILKACEIIKSRYITNNSKPSQPSNQQLLTNDLHVNSFFQTLPRNYELAPQEKVNNDYMFSSSMRYMELQPPFQMPPPPPPQPYNVVLPNNQQFIYPPLHQQSQTLQQSVFTPTEDFPMNPLVHNQPVYSTQPAYIYSENPACYFYTQPQ